MKEIAFQDQIGDNFCFGCGPANAKGLQIKSYWNGIRSSTCTYQPESNHSAGPIQILNGGIIATLIDCHCVCTAMAYAYYEKGMAIGAGPTIWYATASLQINYLRPAPIAKPVILKADIIEVGEKKSILNCSLTSAGKECATGKVVAVLVPSDWRKDD